MLQVGAPVPPGFVGFVAVAEELKIGFTVPGVVDAASSGSVGGVLVAIMRIPAGMDAEQK